MSGYCFSKTATSFWMFGTQVQNVRSVGVFIALSMSAWLTVLGAADDEPSEPPPPHAASTMLALSRPAVASITRRRMSGREGRFMKATPRGGADLRGGPAAGNGDGEGRAGMAGRGTNGRDGRPVRG